MAFRASRLAPLLLASLAGAGCGAGAAARDAGNGVARRRAVRRSAAARRKRRRLRAQLRRHQRLRHLRQRRLSRRQRTADDLVVGQLRRHDRHAGLHRPAPRSATAASRSGSAAARSRCGARIRAARWSPRRPRPPPGNGTTSPTRSIGRRTSCTSTARWSPRRPRPAMNGRPTRSGWGPSTVRQSSTAGSWTRFASGRSCARPPTSRKTCCTGAPAPSRA